MFSGGYTGYFNFQSFITENTLTEEKVEHPNVIGAVKLGVTKNLSFSNDITVEITVSEAYNDMEMEVLAQLEGSSTWVEHATCIITNGICTFTTPHATTYIVNGNGSITGYDQIDINVEVQDTLSLDCYDKEGSSGDHDVNLGIVTAGTPIIAESTCNVTTNDDQGYYLSIQNTTNGGVAQDSITSVLRHQDPHNSGTWYGVAEDDLTEWNWNEGAGTGSTTTTNWSSSIKGLGFSVIQFPESNTTHNAFDTVWTTTGNLCQAGTASDDADYAEIPTSAQSISAVTSYQETSTSTDICYKVDVSPSQQSGIYTGQVTYTATIDASSYHK